MKPPIKPVEQHIIIKYDKIIIQRTNDEGKDTTIIIDRKSKEPERIIHEIKKINENSTKIKNVKREFGEREEDLLKKTISEYMNSADLKYDIDEKEVINYTSSPDEETEEYNGNSEFDNYLESICNDFDINKDNLKNKTMTITYQEYKLKLSENEVSIESPGNNNSTLHYGIDKEGTCYGREYFTNASESNGKDSSLRSIANLLKFNKKNYRIINFDEKKFEEIIMILKVYKDKIEKKN